MRVLITGGTGYLGRAIVRAMHVRGHDVVVFARHASGSGLPGALVDGDVRDKGALERAASGSRLPSSATRPRSSASGGAAARTSTT